MGCSQIQHIPNNCIAIISCKNLINSVNPNEGPDNPFDNFFSNDNKLLNNPNLPQIMQFKNEFSSNDFNLVQHKTSHSHLGINSYSNIPAKKEQNLNFSGNMDNINNISLNTNNNSPEYKPGHKRDKENQLVTNSKDSSKDSKTQFSKQIIKKPKIKLSINQTETTAKDEVCITPNSISKNGQCPEIYKLGHKFYFGNDKSNEYILEDNSISPKQFYIYYNNNHSRFYAAEYENGDGLYLKIIDHFTIKCDIVVGFCEEVYLLLQSINKNDGSTNIKIKFLKYKENVEKTFNSLSTPNITIGRDKKCVIQINNESISKVQCSICFINNEWVIFDGTHNNDNQPNKKSTNGVWLLADNDIALNNKMVFKNGKYVIGVEM